MTREEISSKALEEIDRCKCLILELATGTGKTKIAIELINHICDKVYHEENEESYILILVAKSVHKNEWRREFDKWGGLKTDRVIIECYESLKKYKDYYFDAVACDEIHHLSDTRKDILKTIKIGYNLIGLSATIPKSTKDWLKTNYNTKFISVNLTTAIDNDILPDPTIYLLPLSFDLFPTECIYRNTGKKLPIVECSWAERWKFLRRKDIEIHVYCSKSQYLDDLNSQIEWYKTKAMRGQQWAKIKWLKFCGDRLKWLAQCKNSLILSLLEHLRNYRTLTFCASIEQSEVLGKNCIHSKNKLSQEILNSFNSKKIKHITAVNIVNEGCNITDCRVGILVNINASEIITQQRQGRILRHKQPIMIIPYYKNTREEELVKKHLEGYNPELIKIINNINEIKL